MFAVVVTFCKLYYIDYNEKTAFMHYPGEEENLILFWALLSPASKLFGSFSEGLFKFADKNLVICNSAFFKDDRNLLVGKITKNYLDRELHGKDISPLR